MPHFCRRGVTATVESRLQMEKAAGLPHWLHGRRVIAPPVPCIQQAKELDHRLDFGLFQERGRQSAFGAHGALPQTPPPFMLNRREPPAFDRRLWTCGLVQHRHGGGNRVPGIQLSRIPLSPAHEEENAGVYPPQKGDGLLHLYPP
jgi:hypothetical protein